MAPVLDEAPASPNYPRLLGYLEANVQTAVAVLENSGDPLVIAVRLQLQQALKNTKANGVAA